MKKNKPIRVLWHGNVKANIWANPTQNGEMYSVNYARIYSDKQGKVREAFTFTDVENLRLEALVREASSVCNELRREYNLKSRGDDGASNIGQHAEPPPGADNDPQPQMFD